LTASSSRERHGSLGRLLVVRTAILFPGQGSQSIGMADPWLVHPAGAAVLDAASEALGRSIVEGCHDEEALRTTDFVQPALLACDVAAFRVLQASGVTDVVGMAGHSLGEFAALVAADGMVLHDALELVVIRGTAMQRAGEERPGAMCALLGLGADDAEALCADVRAGDELVVANRNSPAQSVVSGSVAAIERLEAVAKERKIRAVRLNVAGAFHSELMRPAVQPVLDALERLAITDPVFPVAENVTGELVREADRLRELLGQQVVSPVRWEDGIRNLAAAGADRFLEAGPGDVLTKLMKRIDPALTARSIGDPETAAAAAA
jgi:[acyl-carrier-protein] S-malonyltransferase